MAISYQVAADAAIMLNAGGADEAIVKGLSKLKPPGITRSIITVQEFRNAFSRQFAGGAKLGTLDYSGNYISGDTKGQDLLKKYMYTNEKRTDIRAHLNYDDFVTVDLAKDPISAMQVVKAEPGEGDLNGVFGYNGQIVFNGLPATFFIHKQDVATPTITFTQGSGSDDIISDSASGFLTAGFEVGMSLLIDGNPTNKLKYGVIKAVEAGIITLDGEGLIETDGTGSALTLIHGGML